MNELFELHMLGGPTERRYRKLRPEVEAMPWGTIDPSRHSPELVLAARRSWTLAAFQEHRTGAACAEALHALIAARAPLDLIAIATRFPLDELAHVEMCARITAELGGGVPIEHDATDLVHRVDRSLPPLLGAAELVVRFFCVGEAISVPLLRGTWHAARHPLMRAVLGRIVRDEAAHGQFGWTFLDWAEPELGRDERAHLARAARETIDALAEGWIEIEPRPDIAGEELGALGWMETEPYLALARRTLDTHVLRPLRARGIDPGR